MIHQQWILIQADNACSAPEGLNIDGLALAVDVLSKPEPEPDAFVPLFGTTIDDDVCILNEWLPIFESIVDHQDQHWHF